MDTERCRHRQERPYTHAHNQNTQKSIITLINLIGVRAAALDTRCRCTSGVNKGRWGTDCIVVQDVHFALSAKSHVWLPAWSPFLGPHPGTLEGIWTCRVFSEAAYNTNDTAMTILGLPKLSEALRSSHKMARTCCTIRAQKHLFPPPFPHY